MAHKRLTTVTYRNKLDVRQILLYHAPMTYDDPLCKVHFQSLLNKSGLDNPQQYVAFGHHNAIGVVGLSSCRSDEHPFESMWSHTAKLHETVDGKSSIQAINAIAVKDDSYTNAHAKGNDDAYTVFWSTEAPLFFVTMAHLPIGDGSGLPEDYTLTRMKRVKEIIGSKSNVQFCCYASIDCSDIIIFWKANRFDSVINAIEKILRATEKDGEAIFSYLYTVWGINTQLLNSNPASWDENERFDVDIRMTVSSMQYFDLMIKHPFFDGAVYNVVMGDKDFRARLSGVTPSGLLEYVRFFFDDEKGRTLRQKSLLSLYTQLTKQGSTITHSDDWDAILDAIPASSALDEKPTWMQQASEALLRRAHDLTDEEDRLWLFPARELLGKLVQMSKSSIYDDIFYQLIQPAALFVLRLEQYVSQAQHPNRKLFYPDWFKDEPQVTERIQNFERNWNTLVMNAMRNDAQLVQAPERNPAILELPAKINAFYSAFLDQLSVFFHSFDKTPCYDAFLITPKICRYLKILKVFEKDSEFGAVCSIDLPARAIFQPSTTLITIAHDCAHISTNEIRNDKERVSHYAQIAAVILCDALKLSTDVALLCITRYLCAIVSKDCSDVIMKVEQMLKDDTFLHVLAFEHETRQRVATLKGEKEISLVDIRYNMQIADKYSKMLLTISGLVNPAPEEHSIYQELEDYADVLEEAYADVCAFFALRFTDKEYFACIQKEGKINEENFIECFEGTNAFLRVCAVHTVLRNHSSLKTEYVTTDREECDPLVIAIERACEQMESNTSKESLILRYTTSFLAHCIGDLEKSMKKDKQISTLCSEIQDVYSCFVRAHDVACMERTFLKTLMKHRKTIHERIEKLLRLT